MLLSRFSARFKIVILKRVVVLLLALRNWLLVLYIYDNGKVCVAPSPLVLYYVLCLIHPFRVLCPVVYELVLLVCRVES